MRTLIYIILFLIFPDITYGITINESVVKGETKECKRSKGTYKKSNELESKKFLKLINLYIKKIKSLENYKKDIEGSSKLRKLISENPLNSEAIGRKVTIISRIPGKLDEMKHSYNSVARENAVLVEVLMAVFDDVPSDFDKRMEGLSENDRSIVNDVINEVSLSIRNKSPYVNKTKLNNKQMKLVQEFLYSCKHEAREESFYLGHIDNTIAMKIFDIDSAKTNVRKKRKIDRVLVSSYDKKRLKQTVLKAEQDKTILLQGEKIFKNYCASCHDYDGERGSGSAKGNIPTFLDDVWLYNNTPESFQDTIVLGRTAKRTINGRTNIAICPSFSKAIANIYTDKKVGNIDALSTYLYYEFAK